MPNRPSLSCVSASCDPSSAEPRFGAVNNDNANKPNPCNATRRVTGAAAPPPPFRLHVGMVRIGMPAVTGAEQKQVLYMMVAIVG